MKNIFKFQNGNVFSRLKPYDPSNDWQWDYERGLVAGDTNRLQPAWKSNISGYDQGRYTPTSHGNLGVQKEHYNYTKGVEGQQYYRDFGDALLNDKGQFTDVGLNWAKAVDKLLPTGSKATFFDENGNLRKNWVVGDNDAHGRNIRRNFSNLSDYVKAIRNDQILGARHNVFLKRGKRYFYIDNNGQKQWVDPQDIGGFTVSKNPMEQGWEGQTYWDDYELTAPTTSSPTDPTRGAITASPYTGKDFNLRDFTNNLQKFVPGILGNVRLANTLAANSRIFDAKIKGLKPNLLQPYLTHRQVVGDEATKQAYYRRAAEGQTKATRPFTSDADRQMAYAMEARRVGNELKAQGDLADNQEIRRTSDESNQHEWANTQRRADVANNNIIELNKYNAAKQDLIAQKYAANHASWDNYLREKETRARQKQLQNDTLQKQIFALEDQNYIEDSLTPLRQAAVEAMNSNDPEIKKTAQQKIQDYRKRKQELELEMYRKMQNRNNMFTLYSASKGMKLTYKQKDDLLYKSAKDVVDHFRKMSKMSNDSTQKSYPKSRYKLVPHPKTRKMQQGGVAPFMVYTPVTLGGETNTQVSSTGNSTSSGKENKGKDTIDLIKSLFQKVSEGGLPVDVNNIYESVQKLFSQAQAFGEELSTNDIASIYLQSMQQLSNIKHSKEVYDKAKAAATQNEALNEFAVDALGHFIVQDKEGKLSKEANWQDVLKSGKNPITNAQLLSLREYHPEMLLAKGDNIIENTLYNGMGINKIGAQIKALAGKIGTSETKLDGITQVESNRVKQGLQVLQGLPDGNYKTTQLTKEQSQQAKAALNYIKGALSPSQRAILDTHGGTDYMIASFLSSQMDSTSELDIQPLTGKATNDSNSSSGKKGGTDTPASVQFLLGNGYSEVVEFNIGNSQSVKALGRFGILQDKEKNNLGQGSSLQDVSKSQFGPILDLDKATFGGTRLISSGYSHIILNNSDCIGLDLPVKRDFSGNYIPDFQQLSTIEKAEEKIHNNRITDPQQINKIYRDLGLPDKFDSNGNIIPQNYRRFAGIQVILDSKALKGGVPVNANEISEADDEERELFIEEMKKRGNKDYDLSDGFLWSSWGKDKLYKGTIFVPVREDIVAGYTSGGQPLDTDLPNNANQVMMMQYAPKTQQYQKTPPLSSLK